MAEQDRDDLLKVLDWINGIDDGVARPFGHPIEGTVWYIVSNKWLDQWKKVNKLTEDSTLDESDVLGKIDSSDIIDSNPSYHFPNNFILLPTAKLGKDYEILPKKAWKFLKRKYGYEQKIKRRSVSLLNNPAFVEITLFKARCLFIVNKKLKFEDWRTLFFSRTDKISSMIDCLQKFVLSGGLGEYWTVKMWKMDLDEVLAEENAQQPDDGDEEMLTDAELKIKEKKAVEKFTALVNSYRLTPIQFPGQLIVKSYYSIKDSDLTEDEIFVMELSKGYMNSEMFKERPKLSCESCRKQLKTARQCFCKKYYYCDEKCEEKDWSFHWCRKIVKIFTKTNQSRMGIVGLQNLGNTCYMNSGLQCLSHTIALTNFILEDKYLKDINEFNILGSKQAELVTEYASLVKEMWYGTGSKVSPWGVKRAFSDFAKQFVGFFQQDSQEMLGYLIDGIHEDLNRVKKKPYLEDPSSEGKTEQEFADALWMNHKLRNDSIVVDLMHGQYRSEIECPDCGKISITFDPFLMLTLPIPEAKLKTFEYVFVEGSECRSGTITLNKGAKASEAKLKVCEALKIEKNLNITVAEMSVSNIKSLLRDEDVIHKKMKIVMYKEEDSEEMDLDGMVILFLDFRKKAYGYGVTMLGIPHLFKVHQDVSIEELHLEIFKFIGKLKKTEFENVEEEFRKNFTQFFGRSHYGENYFALKIHNPYQFPCAACDRVACAGCAINNDDRKLKFYVNQCKENNLRVSVVFSERVCDLSFIPTVKECYGHVQMKQKGSEKVQLDECFDLFLRKEQLDEQNTVYCSACKDHKKGFKKMGIKRLPQVLVIHLKRFKQKNKYMSSKNDKLVVFPLEGLDMSRFSIGEQGIYDLYAVSNHYGSLEGGHYTAYAKDFDGVWRDFDDSSVSVIDNAEDTIVKEAAYVLFYQRRV